MKSNDAANPHHPALRHNSVRTRVREIATVLHKAPFTAKDMTRLLAFHFRMRAHYGAVQSAIRQLQTDGLLVREKGHSRNGTWRFVGLGKMPFPEKVEVVLSQAYKSTLSKWQIFSTCRHWWPDQPNPGPDEIEKHLEDLEREGKAEKIKGRWRPNPQPTKPPDSELIGDLPPGELERWEDLW